MPSVVSLMMLAVSIAILPFIPTLPFLFPTSIPNLYLFLFILLNITDALIDFPLYLNRYAWQSEPTMAKLVFIHESLHILSHRHSCEHQFAVFEAVLHASIELIKTDASSQIQEAQTSNIDVVGTQHNNQLLSCRPELDESIEHHKELSGGVIGRICVYRYFIRSETGQQFLHICVKLVLSPVQHRRLDIQLELLIKVGFRVRSVQLNVLWELFTQTQSFRPSSHTLHFFRAFPTFRGQLRVHRASFYSSYRLVGSHH